MKRITKTGENFIRTICSGTSNSLISGRYSYNLPFGATEFVPTTFTSNAYDHLGNKIISNAQLGEALIFWFNKYAQLNDIDANILAAQAYEISKFNLWHYGKADSTSGINGFMSIRVYRHIVMSTEPATLEGMISPDAQFSDSEVNKIISGLTDPYIRESYIYRGVEATNDTITVALGNRVQLFQNIIDNPEIMIKAQANLFNEITRRNGGIVANTLFAYCKDYQLSGTSYNDILFNAGRANGNIFVKDGVDCVERIFGYLGDENNQYIPKLKKPKGLWFGYNIDFTQDNFNSFLG